MRLNGWQRMGLVLSVLWVVGAAIHERYEQGKAGDALYQLQYNTCLESAKHNNNCGETVSFQAAMDATTNWTDVVFFAFGPAIAGWFIVLIAIRTFRWISDGFSKNQN